MIRGLRRLLVCGLASVVMLAPILTIPAIAVVGGQEADPQAHPYMVAVVDSAEPDPFRGHICGGSVIATQWIMTAAHCYPGLTAGDLDVIVGIHDLAGSGGQRLDVAEIVVHPDYSGRRANDIALLRVETPMTAPVLPLASEADSQLWDAGVVATVMGWGATETGAPSVLHDVAVPIISDADCSSIYGSKVVPDINICAGDLINGGVDRCRGDSGGPLVVPQGTETVAVGIVSWGSKKCGLPNAPGVYTEVGAFTNWIMSILDAPPGEEEPPPGEEEPPPGEEEPPPGEEPPPMDDTLLVSTSPDRSDPIPLAGSSLSGVVYIFTASSEGVSSVTFTLSGRSAKIDASPPFDLMGTQPDGTAKPLSTSRLVVGENSVQAVFTLVDGTTQTMTATFTVP
jgi:trypsin